jgi:hypothetical protein
MMSDTPRESPAAPLSVRLSVPASGAFLGVATALAGKFARAAGWTGGDADRLGEAVAEAADAAAHDGGPSADLDFELVVVGRAVEVRMGGAGGRPAKTVIRMEPAR